MLQLFLLIEKVGPEDYVPLWVMTGFIGVVQALSWQTRFTAVRQDSDALAVRGE